MTPEDQVILDYKVIRQRLEDDEDLVKSFKKRGESEIEQTFRELDRLLQNNEVDTAIQKWMRQEIINTQEQYNETIRYEQKRLIQRLEDNEQDYRRKLKQF